MSELNLKIIQIENTQNVFHLKIDFIKGAGIEISDRSENIHEENRRPRILREMLAIREIRLMMRFRHRNEFFHAARPDEMAPAEEEVLMMI